MQHKRTFFIISIVLLGSYAVAALLAQPVPPPPFFADQDRVMVIAHQGGEGLRPSNTMLSMQNAIDLGVDILEMDIHSTQDGVLVLMHDGTVDRTTDGSGAIKEMTFVEIQTLDAGHYWTDDGQTYPYRGQNIQVPSLQEIFEAYPDMKMNIEIKQETPSITAPFCQMIRDYKLTDQVLVASFRKGAMDDFRTVCPEVATSMVEDEIRPFWILNLLFISRLFQSPAHAFQVPETFDLPVVGEVDVLTPRFVRNAHAHNIQVHAWTINETDDMERILATGVDGIITDRPDRLSAVLGR